jgi:hypothetical protein
MDPTASPTDHFATFAPILATVVPLPTEAPASSPRAEQVTTFINDITLTSRTIALPLTSDNSTDLEPEELALQWLIDYDTDLNLLPDTPTNRFRL